VALDIQQKMLDKLRAKASAQGVANLRTIHAGAGSGEVEQNYYDRAMLVTVLGEIPDKQAALAEIFGALKPGGLLSVTEVIPDPHYQSRSRVRELCHAAGFEECSAFGNALAFTLNFVRP
jgi:ubiquinone/menaquinone biosynthesis C-methylase UbiE